MNIKLVFLFLSIILNSQFINSQRPSNIKAIYKCLPCGYDCDKATYSQPGMCKSCNMELVNSTTIIFNTIQPNDVCNYIKTHPNVMLLDVRTKEEFNGKADSNFGRLKNAVNIPIQELEAKLYTIKTYKNKDIIVYCSHSHRSSRASYLLTQNGFSKITNMAGGMSEFTSKACLIK